MERKKINKKIVIIAAIFTLVLTATILGFAYAYYQQRIINNLNTKSVTANTKKLELVYADGNGIITGTDIGPGATLKKTFTVQNTGDAAISYSLKFTDIVNTFERTSDWTYVLKRGGTQVATGQVGTGSPQYIIPSRSLSANTTDSYELTLTYANLSNVNQSEDMDKQISLKVDIAESVVVWDNATSGTLLYAIKTNNPTISTVTSPGSYYNGTGVLAKAKDDYGDSYYFRGASTNNFVNFGGMCWRIVRVQGNGTIKLVLADKDKTCASTVTSGTTSAGGAFITDDSSVNTFPYRASGNMRASDLVYSNSDIPRILSAWFNGTTSTYLTDGTTQVKFTTITNKLSSVASKIVTNEWCNDTSVYDQYLRDNNYQEVGYASQARYTTDTYSIQKRLEKGVPELRCNFTGLNSTSATKYTASIGILTADEIAMAGSGSYSTTNTGFYLAPNATNTAYWTSTPYSVYGYYGSTVTPMMKVYCPTSTCSTDKYGNQLYGLSGEISTINGAGGYYAAIRPAIVLPSTTTIASGGTGTYSNPYVIS